MRLILVGQVPPPYHGSSVMTKRLLWALEELGHSTVLINKSFSKVVDEVGKFSFEKVMRLPVLAGLVVRKAASHRPELCIYFISSDGGALIVDAFLLGILRIMRVPYVLRFGGKGFRDVLRRNIFWKRLISSTLKSSLGGVVKGNTLKSDVDGLICSERLVPIPNCATYCGRTKRNNTNGPVQVLCLTNLIPSKGPLEFLKAAKIVLELVNDVRFVLAGAKWRGDFHSELRSYITRNKLEQYISMPGPVYRKAKEALFARSHIFVFPTYYEYETFGLVNVEAMRAGLPVVSSGEGAIPEIVQDGVTGYIVDPKEPNEIAASIVRLVRDRELRERMGRAGRQRFEREYTFDAYLRHWDKALRFFEELLFAKCSRERVLAEQLSG